MTPINEQLLDFAAIFLLGALLGFWGDGYQNLRRIHRLRKSWSNLLDLIFWLALVLIVYFALLRINLGEMGFYVLLALGLGTAAYYVLPGRKSGRFWRLVFKIMGIAFRPIKMLIWLLQQVFLLPSRVFSYLNRLFRRIFPNKPPDRS